MNNNYSTLKLEILVNSHGPHEQVRIREPFCGLQRLGVDCRIFKYPFRLSKVVRPNSLVIWQRPRPSSWEEQLYIIRRIRRVNSILLIEWDDHPDLFPEEIKIALNNISMAPLKLCHALHTSSYILANSLQHIQPISYIFENAVWRIPEINLEKHYTNKDNIRIFIGNQNRILEHQTLLAPLKEWCDKNPFLKIVIIGDRKMANSLPSKNIESYPLLKYLKYRKVMRSCHIALLPLDNNLPNNCKTEIKWMEAAAESVATVGGPGLYKKILGHHQNGMYSSKLNEIIPMAEELSNNLDKRLKIISSSHDYVKNNCNLRNLLPTRIKIYQDIWSNRFELDQKLVQRFPEI